MTTPTFTWSIPDTERNAETGCIEVLHWRLTATDGTNILAHYGTVGLPPKAPTDPTFVAYDQVTLSDAIQWAQAQIGADAVQAHEAALTQELAALANPPVLSGTPW